MKKYNYFGRVSGWGICMLFFLTGLFTGCSENEEDYPKGQRPAGIESVRKVACIGNSITYGARQFLNDREKSATRLCWVICWERVSRSPTSGVVVQPF